jgi:glycosyltransferase involved in cell wall biosynthesis
VHLCVVIPALNEEQSLPKVLAAIPASLKAHVIVVDNGSTDRTAALARGAGAQVVSQPERGYGAACLAGIAALPPECEVVAFLDADYSDFPEELPALLAPIHAGSADLVIGSRMLGRREKGALPPHSLFGNWLAGRLLWILYRQPATDLGPFRAIRREALDSLLMRDRAYGWTVEMQIKAARTGLRTVEVPVRYRKRIGKSKITGSLVASFRAGATILTVLFREGRR